MKPNFGLQDQEPVESAVMARRALQEFDDYVIDAAVAEAEASAGAAAE